MFSSEFFYGKKEYKCIVSLDSEGLINTLDIYVNGENIENMSGKIIKQHLINVTIALTIINDKTQKELLPSIINDILTGGAINNES